MPGIDDSKCVLVIGATAGIGRALALAIWELPSKPTVIVAGRRQERLDELVQKGRDSGEGRIEGVQLDVSGPRESLQKFVADSVQKWPELDTVIFSAGVQKSSNFKKPETIDLDAITSEFNVNYLSLFSLITFFLPHLLKIGESGRPAFIVPIGSAVAISPIGFVSNYCATKAALHSLSISLHTSLEGTNVHVMEILPPLVESELHDEQGTTEMLSKIWMPLDEFTAHAMQGLKRGYLNIVTPVHQPLWNDFERGRIEAAERQAKGLKF